MHQVPVLNFIDFIDAVGLQLPTDSLEAAVAKQYVYVMKSDSGLVKVGVSINPEQRRATLATANGFEVRLVKSFGPIHGAKVVEKVAHDALSTSRRGGEWFACSSEDAIHAVAKAMETFVEPNVLPQGNDAAVIEGWYRAYLDTDFAGLAFEAEMVGRYEELVDSFSALTDEFGEATELVDFYANASKKLLEINKDLVAKVTRLESELSDLLALTQPSLLPN